VHCLHRKKPLFLACREMVDDEERARADGNEEYLNEADPSILRFLIASRDVASAEQLRDDLLGMLVAGHETTASVLTWTVYLLCQNPHTMSKVKVRLCYPTRISPAPVWIPCIAFVSFFAACLRDSEGFHACLQDMCACSRMTHLRTLAECGTGPITVQLCVHTSNSYIETLYIAQIATIRRFLSGKMLCSVCLAPELSSCFAIKGLVFCTMTCGKASDTACVCF
jgi:hypothetical protein